VVFAEVAVVFAEVAATCLAVAEDFVVFAELAVVFAEVAATSLDFEVVVVYLVASFLSPCFTDRLRRGNPPTPNPFLPQSTILR